VPERDYGHRSLSDKLGLAPGRRIAAFNVISNAFLALLADVAGAKPDGARRGAYDRIFLQIDTARDLAAIARIPPHLEPDGALWILTPKEKK
jgi:hypothetical protein